jgi:hypothetical protein
MNAALQPPGWQKNMKGFTGRFQGEDPFETFFLVEK